MLAHHNSKPCSSHAGRTHPKEFKHMYTINPPIMLIRKPKFSLKWKYANNYKYI